MSFECKLDKELGAVVVRATAIIGRNELQAVVDEVVALSGFEPGMHQILDLTDGGVDVDATESRALAQFFQSAEVRTKFGSGYRSAVVATRPVDYGTARVYQVHGEADTITVRVFYDLEEARQWLREAGPPPAPK